MSSHDIKNPAGGVDMRHVMEASNTDDHLLERLVRHFLYHSHFLKRLIL
jgi:hypothetical protein